MVIKYIFDNYYISCYRLLKNKKPMDILRKPRICGLALFDLSLTAIAAIGITAVVKKHNDVKFNFMNVLIVFMILWIIGIILHIVFNQKTMSSYYLGVSEEPPTSRKK